MATSWFQSAPGRLAGRCASPVASRDQAPLEVSIRARPIGRAMPRVRSSTRLRGISFNPRPADWPGDAPGVECAYRSASCFNPRPADWPGDASMRPCSGSLHARFNPRPADWPGDANAITARVTSALFQSAPGRLAGRCAGMGRLAVADRTFQSAPGRLAGRCRGAQHGERLPRHVSIRARPIGRAMPARSRDPADRRQLFQSAPGRLAGRCHDRDPVMRPKPFQSAPGRLAGRCCDVTEDEWVINEFQSAPGRLAGRCLADWGR